MKGKSLSVLFALVLVASLSLVTAVPVLADPALYEHYNTGDDGISSGPLGTGWYAQTFTAESNHSVTSIKLKLGRYGNPGTVIVSVRDTDTGGHPVGPDLASGTTNGNTLPTSSPYEWREIFLLPACNLVDDNEYAIVVRAPDGDLDNYLKWCYDSEPGGYADGHWEVSFDRGESWSVTSDHDFMFEVHGAEVSADLVTKDLGDLTLDAPYEATHWDDIWDLTQGDLTLAYTVDMTGLNQPGTWDTFESWQTWYTEVGLRGEGATDFNPGPFNIYQGKCGGWMVSDSDTWTDSDGYTERGDSPPGDYVDLDDKHGLQASGGRGEGDYDVLREDPNTVIAPIGSFNNYGIWFDRDGTDPYQDNDPDTPSPGGSSVPWSQRDGRKTYSTGGVYRIEIIYHAIDDGLGVMFATVNGDPYGDVEPEDLDVPVPQGFERNEDGTYEYYPAGLSFKGDMEHLQVFAGLWSPSDPPGHDYGYSVLSDIEVSGYLGESDPLVADFTYIAYPNVDGSVDVDFTDTTHGGMPPYEYAWDFENDGTVDSTEQNPSHTYDTAGGYTVKLTVTPFRCVPRTITKMIYPSVGGEAYPVNKVGLIAPWVASIMVIAAGGIYLVRRRVHSFK